MSEEFALEQARFCFGYGSLVNKSTHKFDNIKRAQLRGWRRVWRYAPEHEFVALSVHPAREYETIEGLVAPVTNRDWPALDRREAGYERRDVSCQCLVDGVSGPVHTYALDPEVSREPGPAAPIVLSYLDIVVEGYLEAFGLEGVARFFETTDGWDAPYLDDRRAPIKDRVRQADPCIYPLVDAWRERVLSRERCG